MISFVESDSLNDESENDGSDSGSAGTCAFPFDFDESVGCVGVSIGRGGDSFGHVCVMGSGVLVPTGIESIVNIFYWLCF